MYLKGLCFEYLQIKIRIFFNALISHIWECDIHLLSSLLLFIFLKCILILMIMCLPSCSSVVTITIISPPSMLTNPFTPLFLVGLSPILPPLITCVRFVDQPSKHSKPLAPPPQRLTKVSKFIAFIMF